jgi:hypothetical protein
MANERNGWQIRLWHSKTCKVCVPDSAVGEPCRFREVCVQDSMISGIYRLGRVDNNKVVIN